MSQKNELIFELKSRLKANGFTYSDVAKRLGMSEANIKRMFSEKRFNLGVFDEICQIIGLEISDLAKKVERDSQSLEHLSAEQERKLVSDTKLLLITFLVINGLNFDEIQQHYPFTKPESISLLTRLDRLKLIELLPNNRIKLLISPNFAWRDNGPIQKFFTHYLQKDFLNHSFDQEGEALYFFSGIITPASRRVLISKIKQIAAEFNQCNHAETIIPFDDRQVTSMIMAIRAWKPKVFEEYRV